MDHSGGLNFLLLYPPMPGRDLPIPSLLFTPCVATSDPDELDPAADSLGSDAGEGRGGESGTSMTFGSALRDGGGRDFAAFGIYFCDCGSVFTDIEFCDFGSAFTDASF